MAADLQILERALGYRFSDRDLLIRALTHKSLSAEKRTIGRESADNERLEFLGDAVLGFLVSTALVEQYPTHSEGRLSVLRAALVSAKHLTVAAQELNLGDYLQLGRGEEKGGGRVKNRLLANALEAVIAAIYLDGGLSAAKQFVESHITTNLDEIEQLNYKEILQDRVNELGLAAPKYVMAGSTGPEHAKQFAVEVHLENGVVSRGEGPSKKSAGQSAARAMLDALDGSNGLPVGSLSES